MDTNTPTVKYKTVHAWLYRQRGPAKGHVCHFCPGEATEWGCIANKHLTEVVQGVRVTYSPYTDDYVPVCRSCNCKFDKPPQEVCRKGHTNWGPNGVKRTCRTCQAERKRNYRKKES